MKNLFDKIVQLLEEEGIELKDAKVYLEKIIKEIDNKLWIKLSLSLPLLYNLKDTVWFNLEHLPNGGKEKGLDDLRLLGSNYPTLMFNWNDDLYITKDKVNELLFELEDISQKWSNDWIFVQLFTKSVNGWNGGKDNPSPVIIYDSNIGETPAKYGYNYSKSKFNLLTPKGDYIYPEEDIVLCAIETRLGSYGREPLMKAQLESLIRTCKKAVKENKGILLDVENYNYMS